MCHEPSETSRPTHPSVCHRRGRTPVTSQSYRVIDRHEGGFWFRYFSVERRHTVSRVYSFVSETLLVDVFSRGLRVLVRCMEEDSSVQNRPPFESTRTSGRATETKKGHFCMILCHYERGTICKFFNFLVVSFLLKPFLHSSTVLFKYTLFVSL